MEDFGNMIKKVVSKGALKNAELAKMTGYTPQYISDLLSGKRRWNESTIDKVCQALEITINFHSPDIDQDNEENLN